METALYCKQTGSKEQSIITYLVKKNYSTLYSRLKKKLLSIEQRCLYDTIKSYRQIFFLQI